MLVVGHSGGIARQFCAQLSAQGFHVRHVVPGSTLQALGAGLIEADLRSEVGLRQLHHWLTGREGVVVGALVNLLDLSPPLAATDPAAEVIDCTLSAFRVVKEFLADLRSSAEEGSGWVLNVTSLDGMFGCNDSCSEPLSMRGAGSLGLFKSLLREQRNLHVKNVDIHPTLLDPSDPQSQADVAARLIAELLADDDYLEVGLTSYDRWQLTVKESNESWRAAPPSDLDRNSVVLVTGGAYGITAKIAESLAQSTRARLILAGRSQLPRPEDAETRALEPAALRKWLIDKARASGTRPVLSEIERDLQQRLRNRQILATIESIRNAGSEVEYHSVDVRDALAVGRLLDDIYSRLGRLDGVVHGAGVVEDKLIPDKTPESFERVVGTKVNSALALAAKLRPDRI